MPQENVQENNSNNNGTACQQINTPKHYGVLMAGNQ
jgi:hypothetical protein